MSLVAYDSSDESETEYNDGKSEDAVNQNTWDAQNGDRMENNSIVSSFNLLPVPKHSLSLNSIDISKKDKRIQISIPSLLEFGDEDEDEQVVKPKRIKPSSKGSGLIALLPDPKNKLLIVPSKISAKTVSSAATTELVSSFPVPKKNRDIKQKSDGVLGNAAFAKQSNISKDSFLSTTNQDDVDNVEESGTSNDFFSLSSNEQSIGNVEESGSRNDFFSLSSNKEDVNTFEIKPYALHPDNSDGTNMLINDLTKEEYSKAEGSAISSNRTPSVTKGYSYEASSTFLENVPQQLPNASGSKEDEPLTLNQETLEKLCGRRNRLQRAKEFKLIDIKEDNILSDSKLLLSKQLTEETAYRPSHKKGEGPSAMQKRKHQITYLAHQAKENELELKNQWANNRLTKKQTQAKYGF